MQRTGGVCRYELNLDFLSAAKPGAAVIRPGVEYSGHDLLADCGVQKKVDKSGAGDFCLLQQRRVRQRVDDTPGDFTWIAPQRFGQLHGNVTGVLAVPGGFRPFQNQVDFWRLRQAVTQCRLQQLNELGAQVNRGMHLKMV